MNLLSSVSFYLVIDHLHPLACFTVPAAVGCRLIWFGFFYTFVCLQEILKHLITCINATRQPAFYRKAEWFHGWDKQKITSKHFNFSLIKISTHRLWGHNSGTCQAPGLVLHHQSYKCNLPKQIFSFKILIILADLHLNRHSKSWFR